jgi:hypothetical protein
MAVLKFLYKLWKRDDKKPTSKERVQKYTRDAIKQYEKTLRRLAHE